MSHSLRAAKAACMHIALLVTLQVFCSPGFAAEPTLPAGMDSGEVVRLGERMYRNGLLPDGSPMKGYVKGDIPVDSTIFSCENCHTRSGLGSVEGQVASPPVNGKTLFNPRYPYRDQFKNAISRKKGVTRTVQPMRPAYDDASLAAAIRGGVNSSGQIMSPVMPRYYLEDRDMAILTRYLKGLSAEYSPGVTDTKLSFATIVTSEVSAADRQELLAQLDALVKINRQSQAQKNKPQFAKMFRMLDTAYFREIEIDTWELQGAPETWQSQLEALYRKKPVFAILGGISSKSWQPMHDFCERMQIPCLFPVTDLPVISSTSWYTFYASKGYYQEGNTAARYLAGAENTGTDGSRVLQVVRSGSEGAALAAGFQDAWKETGSGALETVTLKADELFGERELLALLQKFKPTKVVIWDGPGIVNLLASPGITAAIPEVFLSSRYVGKAMAGIPDTLRDRVFLTYPFRLPEDEKQFAGFADLFLLDGAKHDAEKRIASRAFSMIHMFLLGLKELRLDFYRDTLIDVISMKEDQYLPDFERYSFGPGQRYASKGCYIVQLLKGPGAKLVKKSDWVVF